MWGVGVWGVVAGWCAPKLQILTALLGVFLIGFGEPRVSKGLVGLPGPQNEHG